MALNTSDEHALSVIETTLKSARGKISPPDAAAATGLSLDEVKGALERLIELYEARVTVNSENGSLLFVFPYPLRKRDSKSFREILSDIMVAFWRVFKIVYKAAIGVILIVYTLLFIVLIIAAATQGGDRRRRDDSGSGDLIGGIFNAIFSAMRFAAWNNMFYYAVDPYSGMRYRTQQKPSEEKNFIRAVFDFVFGPERPPKDPLADAREAAAFIRKNNGHVTSGQIIALSGVNYFGAEERMAEYAVRFKGDLQVSEDGIVIGEYHELLRREVTDLKDEKIEYYPDEIEPPYVLTGNSSGRNFAVAAMNGFNLVAALTVGRNFDGILFFFICIFPVVFSVLFYLIPLFRWFYVKKKEAGRHRTAMRKKLLGVVISYPGRSFAFNDFLTLGTINASEADTARAVLEKLVPEFQGEVVISGDGTPAYSFPRLSKELVVR